MLYVGQNFHGICWRLYYVYKHLEDIINVVKHFIFHVSFLKTVQMNLMLYLHHCCMKDEEISTHFLNPRHIQDRIEENRADDSSFLSPYFRLHL